MGAGTFDFTGDYRLEAGSTWDQTIPFVDEGGTALDFSAYDKATLTFRRSADDLNAVAAVIDLSEAASDGLEGVWIVSPATGGQLRIVIDADTIAAASWSASAPIEANRSGKVSCELTITGSETTHAWRIFDGDFVIDPESTRAD